ncbi:JAB domain-containing protein [Enterococcus sp. DIV0187]|uniref:JAB domain-containing protein n=1 Tax=Enterococcus sp. DIV0187 TaxID=2774644 RepID=UPI003F6881F1
MENTIICEEILTLKQVKRKRKNKLIPDKVTSSFQLGQWLGQMIGNQTQEHFVVVCLHTKNEIVSYSTVHVGTLNQSVAHPRDILQRALLSNSVRISIGHNHPSSHTNPSVDDQDFTQKLKSACDVVRIELLDHLIVNDKDEYYSFKENDGL